MTVENITIRCPASGASASVLAGYGFNCYRFTVPMGGQEVEVLWAAHGFESGKERPSGSGIPVLFPFPGRIQGGSFTWEGRTYQLEATDGRGNAIHGFVLDRPWRVIGQTASSVSGQFQASVDAPELLEKWPADFCITANYNVAGRALKTEYKIENPSDRPLPFGLGTHPYFRVPLGGASADECVIRLPVTNQWELVELAPTGLRKPLEEAARYQDGLKFAETDLDNVFSGLQFSGDLCTASISDNDARRRIVIEFDRGFRECVVYNPPHREAICIEPYTCVPGPFELNERGLDSGLGILEPGQSFTASVEMRLESLSENG